MLLVELNWNEIGLAPKKPGDFKRKKENQQNLLLDFY